jgi:transposase
LKGRSFYRKVGEVGNRRLQGVLKNHLVRAGIGIPARNWFGKSRGCFPNHFSFFGKEMILYWPRLDKVNGWHFKGGGKEAMMGRKDQSRSSKLFYILDLEKEVPKDHILRKIDSLLDFSFLYKKVESLYGYNGNESVDPVVIFKMWLIGYLFSIFSERKLVGEIRLNLGYRWFLGYDYDDSIPTHSVLCKARRRFGPKIFREVFEYMVLRCQEAGLVGGETVFVDSSIIPANASLDSIVPVIRIERSVDEYYQQLEEEEEKEQGAYTSESSSGINHIVPTSDGEVNRNFESCTDPDAGIVSRNGKGTQICYKDHRAVDGDYGIITQTQATSGDISDDKMLKSLLEEQKKLGFDPEEVVGDKKYGTIENYKELLRQGKKPHIPRSSSPHRKGYFSADDFRYDEKEDVFICPGGKKLTRGCYNSSNKCWVYKAKAEDCFNCELRERCTNNKRGRRVNRPEEGEVLDQVKEILATFQARQNIAKRKWLMEGSFAEGKNLHLLRRVLFRGLEWVQVQFYLVATIQNLKKLVKYGWKKASAPAIQMEKVSVSAKVVFLFKKCHHWMRIWVNRINSICEYQELQRLAHIFVNLISI